jgi:hypothetical protein
MNLLSFWITPLIALLSDSEHRDIISKSFGKGSGFDLVLSSV